jgi:FkbM family methyltransferase
MHLIGSIRAALKKVHALVVAKRFLWRFLSLDSTPQAQSDADYFAKKFANDKNANSLLFDAGLVRGAFNDITYVMKLRPKNIIETHIYLDGLWEPQLASLMSSYLVNGGSAVDIGANIGATSIPLAKYHSNATFYLFEPHPGVFADLRTNVAYNKLANIRLFNKAITNTPIGFMPFYAQKNANNFGLSSFKKNHDIEEYDVINVACDTLDNALSNCNEPIKIIKIDTQGTELQVLLSAQQIVEKYRPAIFFEFESRYFESREEEDITKRELLAFFKRENYELYMVKKDCNYLPKINLAGHFQGDIIAVPAPLTDP